MLNSGRKTDEYMSKMNKKSCLGLKLPNLPDLHVSKQSAKIKSRKVQKTAVFTPSHKDKSQIVLESIGLIVLLHFSSLFNSFTVLFDLAKCPMEQQEVWSQIHCSTNEDASAGLTGDLRVHVRFNRD